MLAKSFSLIKLILVLLIVSIGAGMIAIRSQPPVNKNKMTVVTVPEMEAVQLTIEFRLPKASR